MHIYLPYSNYNECCNTLPRPTISVSYTLPKWTLNYIGIAKFQLRV